MVSYIVGLPKYIFGDTHFLYQYLIKSKLLPYVISSISSSLRYLIIILLTAQLSTYIHHDLSFLGVSKTRTPQVLKIFELLYKK